MGSVHPSEEALADCLLISPEAPGSGEMTQRMLAELSALREDKRRHEELTTAHALLQRERKQSEDLLVAQNRALELVAAAAPLGDVLAWLAWTVEQQSGDQAIAMIMLVEGEGEGRRLRVGAAPSMPRELSDAVDGIAIQRGVGTCSHAAAINDVVVTADIAVAASWEALSHLPLGLGLCACWSTPIRGSDGRVLGTFGTFFRETRGPTGRERSIVEGLCRAAGLAIERRLAEQEREHLLAREREARAEAERASRMKDEFLATLSHELRTPLNAILGWSRILSGGARGEEALARGLGIIERNARAQTQIIGDLLDMSGIISGKVRLEPRPIELAAVLEAAIETTRHAAAAKGVHLEAALDPSAHPLRGDPSRLQQVFWNLISNAVKFTPKGGRVQVRLERAGAQLEVRVADTGEGIAPEFLPCVFERFRQADASTTRRHGGLGLGLAIVKQLVELHGGSVGAESPGAGQGSTFLVSLPLPASHPDPSPAAERRLPRGDGGDARGGPDLCARLAGVKVLVVDDEPDSRALARQILTDGGAEVVTAASAEEALERLRAERPDVLVSDIGMPGEDGYALIKRIRARRTEESGDVPSVALTAYARAEDRVKAVLAGFQMHLAKPLEPAELIAVVAGLAGRGA